MLYTASIWSFYGPPGLFKAEKPDIVTGRCLNGSWALSCLNCGKDFAHSVIAYADAESYLSRPKPDLVTTEYECPHCGHKAVYERANLIYRR
jgi:DNA-directed RNA polymerase subunit RPC12/RpoP